MFHFYSSDFTHPMFNDHPGPLDIDIRVFQARCNFFSFICFTLFLQGGEIMSLGLIIAATKLTVAVATKLLDN